MASLSREHRRELERVVIKAREVAEAGAHQTLESLAVHHHEPWPSMSAEARKLRNRLRAHGRRLGDRLDQRRGTQSIDHLIQECAYQHWHRMLFARFLAECDLLIEPDSGVAISLDECREFAMEQGKDWLTLATDFAVRMLPQIFRIDDVVLEVALAPETRHELESLLKSLARDVFTADDSLGWVYQFWQTEEKNKVNRSERKVGADELPAVTELFTDDYMVLFLLHNTLGAWWKTKRNAEGKEWRLQNYEWTYLRLNDDETPAAGTFSRWPQVAKDLKILDPCMGSGHFLVFALPILVGFRMQEEGTSCEEAVVSVLRDNLFGLEIDPRCTQIAAFNLALSAWRMIGFCVLPALNLACSGLGIHTKQEEWIKLAEDSRTCAGLERLYRLFEKAPVLGSLISPCALGGDLLSADFRELQPVLAKALKREDSDEKYELSVTAQGIAKAAEILAEEFTLVATNVPYLGRGKQVEALLEYCDNHHPEAKADLATCFIERLFEFCATGATAAFVVKQEWLFLGKYRLVRRRSLLENSWGFVAHLGPRSFEAISGERVTVSLHAITKIKPSSTQEFLSLDVSAEPSPHEKAQALIDRPSNRLNQLAQLENPDSRVTTEAPSRRGPTLGTIAESYQGIVTGDLERFRLRFWEVPKLGSTWVPFRTTVSSTGLQDGCYSVLLWEGGNGSLHRYAQETRYQLHDMHESGNRAWQRTGIALNRMSGLQATLYYGEHFDNNVAVLIPLDDASLSMLLAFCTSKGFAEEVRRLDRTLKVTNQTLIKVPFESESWERTATEKYSEGIVHSYPTDPTQWFFPGDPRDSNQPLHVAVPRILGYSWPRQTGSTFAVYPPITSDGLEQFADPDGIVCLEALHGELPAADRVRAVLAKSLGENWSPSQQNELVKHVDSQSIEDWLRDKFFSQHSNLFHQRPFIWHIFDGLKNGFNVLVDYHKLAAPNGDGRRTLEKLIYTYLGQWIEQQRTDQKKGIEGADLKLAAAEHLKKELENILRGEPPYDIFVRWKPLHEQPIGWEPDLNDGVRINIRPFMKARPLNAKSKNATILRVTPNIKWEKDRGKDPNRDKEEFPWFWSWDQQTQDFEGGKTFDGNRWNDLHYTRAFKEQARKKKNESHA